MLFYSLFGPYGRRLIDSSHQKTQAKQIGKSETILTKKIRKSKNHPRWLQKFWQKPPQIPRDSNEMVSSPEFGDPADANVSTDISADAIVRILTSALLSTDTTFFLCSNWF